MSRRLAAIGREPRREGSCLPEGGKLSANHDS